MIIHVNLYILDQGKGCLQGPIKSTNDADVQNVKGPLGYKIRAHKYIS